MKRKGPDYKEIRESFLSTSIEFEIAKGTKVAS